MLTHRALRAAQRKRVPIAITLFVLNLCYLLFRYEADYLGAREGEREGEGEGAAGRSDSGSGAGALQSAVEIAAEPVPSPPPPWAVGSPGYWEPIVLPHCKGAAEYSLADLARHATAADLWVSVRGMVLNVTDFLPNHPGGSILLSAAGVDATEMFEQHHPPFVPGLFGSFCIGRLRAAGAAAGVGGGGRPGRALQRAQE
eukprot:TRINITY_DN8314_c0_g3_i2.p1 TRINITY_DN8314_c0_g3~~TRINITY_DN8314_c0_g3_i2.p1  ORF type:complete len:232 (+),score=48.33 TRINITY_DN8314_c0_g3_i2:98-697(+)